MRWSAHRDEYAGPARQGRRFGHGDAEKDVANHECDCSQPVDDSHRPVLTNSVKRGRRLLSQERGKEPEVSGDGNQIRTGEGSQEPINPSRPIPPR
jgi:hypothetical protein